MDMREHHMGYRETVRKYWDVSKGQEANYKNAVQRWERIYLEEGAEGLMKERRGRSVSTEGKKRGRPPKKAYAGNCLTHELLETVSAVYAEKQEIKATALVLELPPHKVKKLLITHGDIH